MPFFSQCPPPKFRTKLPLIISLFIIYNRKGGATGGDIRVPLLVVIAYEAVK